jgi:hypothetical protein
LFWNWLEAKKTIAKAALRGNIGLSIFGLQSIKTSENCCKLLHPISSSARGGLEPAFRVLFSAIFRGFCLGNFHQGRNLWKWAEAKVWSFVVNLRTNFVCVSIVLCLSTGIWRIPV